MGQYHAVINLDKKECIHPHGMGTVAKAWEQIANSSFVPAAMFMLMVNPEYRGGGDLQHSEVAGRWHGDHVVVIGDYAENGDFDFDGDIDKLYDKIGTEFTDISAEAVEGLKAESVWGEDTPSISPDVMVFGSGS